jgi:DNA-binding GntR family transcriptional regulator
MNTEASDCFHQPDGERMSRVEYAYRKIKKNITKNDFPAGFQILEPELAKVLGVSRTPVREALIRLEADNLIQLVPRRGMRVLPIVQQDVSELIEALTSIQVTAAKVVCSNENVTDFANLEQKIHLLHQASLAKNKSDWIEADEKFHIEFVSLVGNSRIISIFKNLLSQLHRAKFLSFGYLETWDDLIAANSELILALKERKRTSAISAIYRYKEALGSLFEHVKNEHQCSEF